MQGASRIAQITSRQALSQLLSGDAVGGDLFALTRVLDDSGSLRRALGNSFADPVAKRELTDRLFGGKVGDGTLEVVRVAVSQRWVDERDLSDALEELGVQAILICAERADRLDQVEDELFRFERTVVGDPGLRDALSDRQRSGDDKVGLVSRLLDGKVAPETIELTRQAAAYSRGQRFECVLESYVGVAVTLRGQLMATVTAAQPLDDGQTQRFGAALAKIYGRQVWLNVIIDPSVVGGLRVQVGNEVIDGTILARLEEARRMMVS